MAPEVAKNNLRKAAILLTLLGPEAAQQMIKSFSPEDMDRLGKELVKCQDINRDEGEQVIREFFLELKDQKIVAHGGIDYVEKVLAPAMDPERAQRLIQKIHRPQQIVPFEFLSEVEPEKLLPLIAAEHPQTQALIIANLPREISARVLMKLPEDRRLEVAKRIAFLDQSTPDLETIQEIEARLRNHLKAEAAKTELAKSGGTQTCAEILNLIDKQTAKGILENLEQKNPEMAAEVKMKMVRFEDLVKLTDQEIQRILKEVETHDLSIACLKAEKPLEEAIFRNMSQRGAEMLKEDIEVLQNIKAESIRASRGKIAEIMRRLDEEGVISLQKGGLDEVL